MRWPGYGHATAEIVRLFLADLGRRARLGTRLRHQPARVDDALVAALRSRLLAD